MRRYFCPAADKTKDEIVAMAKDLPRLVPCEFPVIKEEELMVGYRNCKKGEDDSE